jgi:hypothetical protein
MHVFEKQGEEGPLLRGGLGVLPRRVEVGSDEDARRDQGEADESKPRHFSLQTLTTSKSQVSPVFNSSRRRPVLTARISFSGSVHTAFVVTAPSETPARSVPRTGGGTRGSSRGRDRQPPSSLSNCCAGATLRRFSRPPTGRDQVQSDGSRCTCFLVIVWAPGSVGVRSWGGCLPRPSTHPAEIIWADGGAHVRGESCQTRLAIWRQWF